MQLKTENAGSVRDPTDQDVRDLLINLQGFAILEHNELTYLQAAGTPQDDYWLEYQDGDADRHYECPDRLPFGQVVRAFIAYVRGDDSWREEFSWRRIEVESASRRGCLGAAVVLWTLIAPILAALSCCTLTGCSDKTVHAVVVYQAAPPSAEIAAQGAISEVAASLSRRLNGRGQARVLSGGHIEVELYDDLKESEVASLVPLIGAQGAFEFRIMASPTTKAHAKAIELAEALPGDESAVEIDGKPVARWVEYNQLEFGDESQARMRGLVVRTVGKKLQALAMLDDGLNVDGTFMRSAVVDTDETGRPQVNITFNKQGAFRFGQLTGKHTPRPNGERFNLGILLDSRLLSAPTIESKITDRARISGGAMTAREVQAMVKMLDEGMLPYPIRLISSEIIKK